MKLTTKLRGSLMIGLGAMALMAFCGGEPAQAGERRRAVVSDDSGTYVKSRYRKRTRVYGYMARRGGYSYSASDAAIDYRDTSILRDPLNGRRQGGPFDNGFFFDSGISRHNDSPYLN